MRTLIVNGPREGEVLDLRDMGSRLAINFQDDKEFELIEYRLLKFAMAVDPTDENSDLYLYRVAATANAPGPRDIAALIKSAKFQPFTKAKREKMPWE